MPRRQNIRYPQVPGGFACPRVAYGGCQPRVFTTKHLVWQHLDNVHREVLDEKKSNLGNKVIILYRWTSIIPGAEELPALVADAIFNRLAKRGYDPWMDRQSLSVDGELKTAVKSGLKKNKVAVICIGVGDLARCADPTDFFRWEIESALASETLKVVFVVHGTNNWEDLICGNSTAEKVRKRKLLEVGQWGEDLLDRLRGQYVIQFKLKKLDIVDAEQICPL